MRGFEIECALINALFPGGEEIHAWHDAIEFRWENIVLGFYKKGHTSNCITDGWSVFDRSNVVCDLQPFDTAMIELKTVLKGEKS